MGQMAVASETLELEEIPLSESYHDGKRAIPDIFGKFAYQDIKVWLERLGFETEELSAEEILAIFRVILSSPQSLEEIRDHVSRLLKGKLTSRKDLKARRNRRTIITSKPVPKVLDKDPLSVFIAARLYPNGTVDIDLVNGYGRQIRKGGLEAGNALREVMASYRNLAGITSQEGIDTLVAFRDAILLNEEGVDEYTLDLLDWAQEKFGPCHEFGVPKPEVAMLQPPPFKAQDQDAFDESQKILEGYLGAAPPPVEEKYHFHLPYGSFQNLEEIKMHRILRRYSSQELEKSSESIFLPYYLD